VVRRSNPPATIKIASGFALAMTKSKEYRMAKKNKRMTVSVTSSTSRTEFNPDYSDVKKDLTRIGTLAGFFIAVLIALSFFLK
jgi:hypothetical protein